MSGTSIIAKIFRFKNDKHTITQFNISTNSGWIWVVLNYLEYFRYNLIKTLKYKEYIWTATCDFQQCGIFTSVDSDEPMQPHFKLRNSKRCPISSLKLIEYSSNKQRLWSVCTYAQAALSLCWSHIPHCWKSHERNFLLCRSGTWFGSNW